MGKSRLIDRIAVTIIIGWFNRATKNLRLVVHLCKSSTFCRDVEKLKMLTKKFLNFHHIRLTTLMKRRRHTDEVAEKDVGIH